MNWLDPVWAELELESELRSTESDSEFPSMELKSDMRSLIFYTGVRIKMELLLSELELQKRIDPGSALREPAIDKSRLKKCFIETSDEGNQDAVGTNIAHREAFHTVF